MFVILAYDIKAKRVGKALKICRRYLHHVQKSVFEGNITESQLNCLKSDMLNIIDTNYDSVRIYRIISTGSTTVEEVGVTLNNHFIV